VSALEQALERCQKKKNLALAAQIRRRLEPLRDELSNSEPTSAA